ncbi:MAG: hypothetical protein EXR86_09650 [Gammaproteobacteria bacterium]|nr:hypothetical protein [Gammaproteobacteria bacterium]
METRINAMCPRDRAWVIFIVTLLWVVVGVVFFGIASLITIPAVNSALIVSGLLVLIFNTASSRTMALATGRLYAVRGALLATRLWMAIPPNRAPDIGYR